MGDYVRQPFTEINSDSLYENESEALLAAYDRKANLYPESPEAWYKLGYFLRRIGDYFGAIDAFRRVEKIRIEAAYPETLGLAYSGLENV